MMESRERRQLLAFAVALFCYVVAIALQLTKVENRLVLQIFMSVGFVAFMVAACVFRQRQG